MDPLSVINNTSPKDKDYHTKVMREVAKSNSKFLAGCVFKIHPRRANVTRSNAKMNRKWVNSGFVELIYLIVNSKY